LSEIIYQKISSKASVNLNSLRQYPFFDHGMDLIKELKKVRVKPRYGKVESNTTTVIEND